MIMRFLYIAVLFLLSATSHAGVSSTGGWAYLSSLVCTELNAPDPVHPLGIGLMAVGQPVFSHSLQLTVRGYPSLDYFYKDIHEIYNGSMDVAGNMIDCKFQCRFFENREDGVTFDLIYQGEKILGVLNMPGRNAVPFDCH